MYSPFAPSHSIDYGQQGLEPKFNAIVKDKKYEGLPIIWADLTIQNNKEYVKSIGVVALPSMQFYSAGLKEDTFPCGPSKGMCDVTHVISRV